ncbi:NUDIX hydrolase domain-like protein [Glomus cerebriforme]|uniref:NUDIX hydrolase domain-like protein n=1 Tax=Glomus cerebriforme TaxID=658196 RepID=A0A397SXJ8_9GLOM|nr:NUDIX hydrolase domain-like protein [Glomus cerebriforme]
MSSLNNSLTPSKNLCNHPRVGLGVFVTRGNKFLIGKRKGSHCEGTWQLPGGHLEFGESFKDCARREVLEETNLEIKNITYQTVTNTVIPYENKHYVDIYLKAEIIDDNAEPVVMEPNKCECWEWVTWDEFIKGGILEDKIVNKYRPMFRPMEILLIEQPEYSPV